MRSSSIWFNHFLIPTSGWKRKNSYSLQPEVDFFWQWRGYGFPSICISHKKNILFSKNCHVAVSGSKVTNDPSKCSQERGLLPYYHNLFVMFVIFGKKWRWSFWKWRGCGFPSICISHKKNILFSKNCHVAVSGSKVTNDPSKCSQERGLLPYYHNLFVMFVIFGKKWRWSFWKWRGYGFPSICISHKKHTIF